MASEKEYGWRPGFFSPVPAQTFGEEVDKIIAETGKTGVRAEEIVERAARRRSPLRTMFEWDAAKAAHQHRLTQARHALGALTLVRVRITAGPVVSHKAYFVAQAPADNRRSYIPSARIVADRELRVQVIQSARSELESFIKKFSSIAAFGNFIARLEQVRDEMLDEVARLEVDANARRSSSTAGAGAGAAAGATAGSGPT